MGVGGESTAQLKKEYEDNGSQGDGGSGGRKRKEKKDRKKERKKGTIASASGGR